MEIRLMDKNPETGRFVNVEIYSEEDFKKLIAVAVGNAITKVSFWDRLRNNLISIVDATEKKIFDEFKQRLKENKN